MPRLRNNGTTIYFDDTNILKIELMNVNEYFELDILDAFILSKLIRDAITAQINYKEELQKENNA